MPSRRRLCPSVHPAGAIIAGRYRLVELLGQGGFGEVHRAIDLDMRQEVALKLLHHERAISRVGLRRFQREAQLAQKLEHKNTVRPLDFGQSQPEGLPYIAWELLRGRSLEDLLDEVGPLPPARVAHIAAQVLGSLGEAHGKGVVHRDIKPDNIFLIDFQDEPDFVKVLDFGMAKPVGPLSLSLEKLTDKDEIIGTPSYMAPEQVISEPIITPATDLYALGLVVAEMLTGRVVVVGQTPVRIMLIQASEEQVPLPESILRSPLGPVIERAVQKPPDARYQSAEEMLIAFKAALARLDPVQQQLLLPGVTSGRLSSHALSLGEVACQEPTVPLSQESSRPTTPAPRGLNRELAKTMIAPSGTYPLEVEGPTEQRPPPRGAEPGAGGSRRKGCAAATALVLAALAAAALAAVALTAASL